MEWNVYYYNINSHRIMPFNVFNHVRFKNEVLAIKNKTKNYEEFTEEIRKILLYYFWSKSEYEVIIAPWCGGNNKEAIKVDIYSQVIMNWEHFINYIWEFDNK